MAYNPYLPTNYNPNYFLPYPQQQNQNTNSIVWVQGTEGAKAYPVGAGNNVLLMDSEESVFYIKSSDQSGMPMPLRIFDYTERTEQKEIETNFVTKDELDKTIAELMADLKKKPAKKKTIEEEEDDE